MKNIKLNKLAENRLNEKEMREITGGAIHRVYTHICSAETGICCGEMCSCLVTPPFINTTASNGDSNAASVQETNLPPLHA